MKGKNRRLAKHLKSSCGLTKGVLDRDSPFESFNT